MSAMLAPDKGSSIEMILNRWSPVAREEPACHCTDCQQIRARGFRCDQCGYAGEPWILGCWCGPGIQHPVGACDSAHGAVECPICHGGDYYTVGLTDHLIAIIRDLRREVAGRHLTLP